MKSNERLQYILDDKIITSHKLDWITYVKTEKLMNQDVDEALMFCLKRMFDGTVLSGDLIDMLPTSHIHILIEKLSEIYMDLNQEILELNKDEVSKKKIKMTTKEILNN